MATLLACDCSVRARRVKKDETRFSVRHINHIIIHIVAEEAEDQDEDEEQQDTTENVNNTSAKGGGGRKSESLQ